jgi:hypothetical protein
MSGDVKVFESVKREWFSSGVPSVSKFEQTVIIIIIIIILSILPICQILKLTTILRGALVFSKHGFHGLQPGM